MSTYKIEVTECEDREGHDIWIVRSDGEFCSLVWAENEGEMDDGENIPSRIIWEARRIADKVGY